MLFQVDRVGRRPFLLLGSIGVFTGLLILSLGFMAEQPLVSFAACCTIIAAYAVSFGPITWLVTAEMFPPGVRGKALSIGQV